MDFLGKPIVLNATPSLGLTLCSNNEIVYKCSDYYAPETEGALIWNDPEIGIDWPVTTDLTISDKDKTAQLLAEFESPFVFGVNS